MPDDYDERAAIHRLIASERARVDQPPPATVFSDASGHWFRVWCGSCDRAVRGWHKGNKAVTQRHADAHNETVHA